MDSKAKLSDTFHVLLPKNRSGGITKHQQVDIQIPKSEWVLNLQKAYISVELKLNVKTSKVCTDNDFIGTLNSACIFDQVTLNHGKPIYTDTFSQVNSRIWQMSKSDSYLKANYASFANWEDMRLNTGFIMVDVSTLKVADTWYNQTLRMKIPLPCLFNCFDECDEFPTSMLNDNITLSMQLSDIHKWACFVNCNSSKMYTVKPFTGNSFIDNVLGATGTTFEIDDNETSYYINDIKLVCPAHYPSMEEMEKIDK